MDRKISQPELHWYAAQLLYIPEVLEPDGEQRCREIGRALFDRFGHAGMVAVCEFVRDMVDSTVALQVERGWHGIGSWLG